MGGAWGIMRGKYVLILFPLISMFVISISGVGSLNTIVLDNGDVINPYQENVGLATFEGSRTVNDERFQDVYFDASIDGSNLSDFEQGMSMRQLYLEYSDQFPLDEKTWWERIFFGSVNDPYVVCVRELDKRLNAVFGESNGHDQIAEELINLMENYHLEYGEFIPETNVELQGLLSIDPAIVEELNQIRGRGINVSKGIVFVGVFIGLMGIAIILGIRIFGSGLAGTSIGLVFKLVTFLLLWGLVSLGSSSVMRQIPLVGVLVWISLTFMYMLGVILSIEGGNE